MKAAIDMRGVTKAFRGRTVLDRVDWAVASGSIHGLIGANGAGKTTLLRLALGVLWPKSGTIKVLGQALGRENAELRQHVHYVVSGRAVAPGFRVDEWLCYARLAYDRWDEGRAQRLIKALELDRRAVISQLSTGMQMGLKLAVAIAARPDLMLLDEPTNGLDLVVKRQVLQLIIDMAAAEGTTLVIATHNIEDVERIADAVTVLYRGRVLVQKTVDEMKRHVHRWQVVLPNGWPAELDQDPDITAIERRGQVALITAQGPSQPFVERLTSFGATLIEPIPMDLSEVFTAVLEREGYTRHALDWDAL